MLHHRVPRFVTAQRAHRWEPVHSDRIAGKTLVVVGVGRIGAAAARLARRFGLRVLGVRRTGATHGAVDAMYRPRDLALILDFTTRAGVVGQEQIARLRPTGPPGQRTRGPDRRAAGPAGRSRRSLLYP